MLSTLLPFLMQTEPLDPLRRVPLGIAVANYWCFVVPDHVHKREHSFAVAPSVGQKFKTKSSSCEPFLVPPRLAVRTGICLTLTGYGSVCGAGIGAGLVSVPVGA
jgi:hypothetical protein